MVGVKFYLWAQVRSIKYEWACFKKSLRAKKQKRDNNGRFIK